MRCQAWRWSKQDRRFPFLIVGSGACARRVLEDPGLVGENDAEQRGVNFKLPIVIYEAQSPELVHEKADARAGGADHVRKGLLADFRDDRLRAPFLAEIGQQ